MMTVDQFLSRARSMLERSTVYWAGAGGKNPDGASAGETIRLREAWLRLDAATQAQLLQLVQEAGLDVTDPWQVVHACDCSGFVCWALGSPRQLPVAAFPLAGGWQFTDSMHADAIGPQHRFRRQERARPGSLVVYPKPAGEPFGHVAIVTQVDAAGRATAVIHCAADNFRAPPFDAVRENAPTAFERQPASVYAWCRDVVP